jgi:hypothetical protein
MRLGIIDLIDGGAVNLSRKLESDVLGSRSLTHVKETQAKTPNIDRLAEGLMVFRNAGYGYDTNMLESPSVRTHATII